MASQKVLFHFNSISIWLITSKPENREPIWIWCKGSNILPWVRCVWLHTDIGVQRHILVSAHNLMAYRTVDSEISFLLREWSYFVYSVMTLLWLCYDFIHVWYIYHSEYIYASSFCYDFHIFKLALSYTLLRHFNYLTSLLYKWF